MALQLGARSDPLGETGVTTGLDQPFSELLADLDRRFTAIDGKLHLLAWMVGTIGAIEVSLLLRLISLH